MTSMHSFDISARSARLSAGFLAAILCMLTGCQRGYRATAERVETAFSTGEYVKAAEIAGKAVPGWEDFQAGNVVKAAKIDGDTVAYALDAGSVAFFSDTPASVFSFDTAYEVERPFLDTTADESVSEIVASIAVNDTVRVYKATPGERIMLNTWQAMNRMRGGDLAGARIELNRAHDWQQDAVARYARAIDRDLKALEEDSKKRDFNLQEAKAKADPQKMAELTAGLEDATAYSAYRNPFTSYLHGVFLLATSREAGDLGNARSNFREVWEMVPEARGVVEVDLQSLNDTPGADMPATTWVFVMSGLAPRKTELWIPIPIPVGNGKFVLVSAAFPLLKPVEGCAKTFAVTTHDGETAPVLLADIDRIVKAEFKEQLPAIITMEILRAAVKAGVTYVASQGAKEGGGQVSIVVWVVGTIYQLASTAADLRSWRMLPKRIYVARVPTPDDGVVGIRADGGPVHRAAVEPRAHNVVVVWLPSASTPAPAPAPAIATWSLPKP